MKKLKLTALFLLLLSCGAFARKPQPVVAPQPIDVKIIPQPASIEIGGGHLEVTPGKILVIYLGDSQLEPTAKVFAEDMKKLVDYVPPVVFAEGIKWDQQPIDVMIGIDSGMEKEEYILEVSSFVKITGGSPAGVFYGLQTLRQLFVADPQWGRESYSYKIPAVRIHDKPFFGYRGAMLDVCRHFANIEEVKKFIDLLAMHKMNTFHWHLTDDQGWRIQINSHPELTSKGSVRTGTLLGHGGRPPFEYDDKPYAGCYTQDEVREVVRYAAERYINVIPEVEMPGHAMAALNAYPELGCTGGPYEVWRRWGVSDEVFCAGNDAVFALLEDVLEEVMELFPSEIIHIGGDECPKKRWEACPKCQARMKENNIPDEHHLQSYFIQRIEKFVNARGRHILGWDEILEGGLSQNAIVMSWRGAKGGIEAAKAGNYVVVSPTTHVYLDYYQDRNRDKEPFSIGGYLPLEKTYQLDPYDGLEAEYYKYILGVQCNIWREYIKTMSHTEYMALPRLAAVAETGWAYDRKDFESFVDRLSTMRLMYDIYDYNYARHIFEGGGRIVDESGNR